MAPRSGDGIVTEFDIRLPGHDDATLRRAPGIGYARLPAGRAGCGLLLAICFPTVDGTRGERPGGRDWKGKGARDMRLGTVWAYLCTYIQCVDAGVLASLLPLCDGPGVLM